MAHDVVLKIPVKRYVLNYIEKKYSLEKSSNIWRIKKAYKEERYLISLLERAPSRYEKYNQSAADVILYIEVPWQIVKNKGSHLSNESIDDFVLYIKSCVLDEITTYYNDIRAGRGIKACDRVNVSMNSEGVNLRKVPAEEGVKFFGLKDVIYSKIEKYNISEDELTYDAAAKHVQRANKNKKAS